MSSLAPTGAAPRSRQGATGRGEDYALIASVDIASYQLGPLLLEARGMYSPNRARDNLAKGIRCYQPLDTDGNYYAADWTATRTGAHISEMSDAAAIIP